MSLGDPKGRLPEMRWLGVKLEQIAGLNGEGLNLTSKDQERAVCLLEAMTLEEGYAIPELEDCRTELQKMLVARKKAEIQTVDSVFGLKRWLEDEMIVDVLDAGC